MKDLNRNMSSIYCHIQVIILKDYQLTVVRRSVGPQDPESYDDESISFPR
jgi:hypothetical protein